MASSRIKFIWGGAKVVPGTWYFGLLGLYRRTEGKHRTGFVISVRGLVIWVASAIPLLWLAGFTALYFLWQANPYSHLEYTDALLYPFRREEISRKKGQAFIAQGTDLWREKKYVNAANLLRQGLARNPQALPPRLLLAQYSILLGRNAEALSILQQGLTTEYPGRSYLQTLLDLSERMEDFQTARRLCERFRKTPNLPAAERGWIDGRYYGALLAAGRTEEALALANTGDDSSAWSERRVVALLALGRMEEAGKVVEAWLARPASDREAALRLSARVHREMKQFDQMERALDEYRRLQPALPAPAVYGVVQRSMAGLDKKAAAALEDYFFYFGGSAANLQLVATPVAEINDRPLLDRCVAVAAEQGYDAAPFQMLQLLMALRRGDAAAAAQIFARMPAPKSTDTLAVVSRDWLQRVIEAAISPSEPAQLALQEAMRNRLWPLPRYAQTIEVMRRAGRLKTARELAARAVALFPASERTQATLKELEQELAAQASAEAANIAANAPQDQAALLNEKVFFNRLTDAVRAEKWSDADDLIRTIHRQATPPQWLASREEDIQLVQVRIARSRGATIELVNSAKLYLTADLRRSAKLLELAREFHAAGDKESAITLVKEIVKRSPDFALARRTLTEWQPPAATSKK